MSGENTPGAAPFQRLPHPAAMRSFLLLATLGLSLSACASSSDTYGKGRSGDARAGRSDGKVALCHRGRTIRVDGNAVRAHLNHGDRRGACRR